MVRETFGMLRPNTAVGVDQWRPDELRLLTRAALAELVIVYQTAEREGVWPMGALLNIRV